MSLKYEPASERLQVRGAGRRGGRLARNGGGETRPLVWANHHPRQVLVPAVTRRESPLRPSHLVLPMHSPLHHVPYTPNRFAEQEGVAAALREMVEGKRAALEEVVRAEVQSRFAQVRVRAKRF